MRGPLVSTLVLIDCLSRQLLCQFSSLSRSSDCKPLYLLNAFLLYHSNILYRSFDGNAHQFAGETNSEDKNIKKTKRKSKTEKNGETVNMKMPLVPLDKKTDDRSSQVRVLSNGVTIEVLEMGKPDGKVAASGKKVKSRCVQMLY